MVRFRLPPDIADPHLFTWAVALYSGCQRLTIRYLHFVQLNDDIIGPQSALSAGLPETT